MEAFKLIMFIILILGILGLLFAGVMFVKNQVTFMQHVRITNAIYNYHMDLINHRHFGEYEVHYEDEEDYDKTMWRLWDWGCTRILPKEKFEIIKPYLDKEVK